MTQTLFPIGFGSYRVDDRNQEHEAALDMALNMGVQLIDTSSNYSDGHSEKLIGQVLEKKINQKDIERENICVVTKAGYIQGTQHQRALLKEKEGQPFLDVVKIQDGLWHCISPDFLLDQIQQSLTRLKQNYLDVFLLHNPEYFFEVDGNREVFYARIEQAFRFLESQAQAGLIRAYGVSSNTFGLSQFDAKHVSLQRLLSIVNKVSSEHHFSFVQFPFNLFETGALFEKNNEDQSVMELAKKHNLITLCNRPLNAFIKNRLMRLASFKSSSVHVEPILQEALFLENQYPMLHAQEQAPFMFAHWFEKFRDRFDFLNFKDVFQYELGPLLKQTFKHLEDIEEIQTWSKEYKKQTITLIEVIMKHLENKLSKESQDVSDYLDSHFKELQSLQTLSQKVLALYLSIESLDVVLLGMRDQTYVQNALSSLPKLDYAKVISVLKLIKNAGQ